MSENERIGQDAEELYQNKNGLVESWLGRQKYIVIIISWDSCARTEVRKYFSSLVGMTVNS